MSLHRCTETECPFIGQLSTRGCACHQTDEQVLRALISNLVNNAERHPMHVGYDSGSGGGNYIYADVICTDDEEFLALAKVIQPSPKAPEQL